MGYGPSKRRPGEGRDPYAVSSDGGTVGETFCNYEGRWLWVPAFAGTKAECVARASTSRSSPSLPRRDDLDLVAVAQRGLGPAAPGHHVVIHGDCEMRALIVEFAQQRLDAGGGDLALLAVDDHAHCITSLSICPRST